MSVAFTHYSKRYSWPDIIRIQPITYSVYTYSYSCLYIVSYATLDPKKKYKKIIWLVISVCIWTDTVHRTPLASHRMTVPSLWKVSATRAAPLVVNTVRPGQGQERSPLFSYQQLAAVASAGLGCRGGRGPRGPPAPAYAAKPCRVAH